MHQGIAGRYSAGGVKVQETPEKLQGCRSGAGVGEYLLQGTARPPGKHGEELAEGEILRATAAAKGVERSIGSRKEKGNNIFPASAEIKASTDNK